MPNKGKPFRLELAGQRFGRWLVLRKVKRRSGRIFWLCQCDCGTKRQVFGYMLTHGKTNSCGCWRREWAVLVKTKHGQAGIKNRTAEYNIWCGMKARCYDPNTPAYKYYGALGVRMSDDWLAAFENYFRDTGKRPSAKHSIDRWPDRNGNYEKGNVRWATAKEQQNNRRPRKLGFRIKDRVGQRFGRLVVLRMVPRTSVGHVFWTCQCDCGRTIDVDANHLRNGNTRSCGCWRREFAARPNRLKRQIARLPPPASP